MAFLLWGKNALIGLNDVKKIQRDNHNEGDECRLERLARPRGWPPFPVGGANTDARRMFHGEAETV
jgi:hypothetical protein